MGAEQFLISMQVLAFEPRQCQWERLRHGYPPLAGTAAEQGAAQNPFGTFLWMAGSPNPGLVERHLLLAAHFLKRTPVACKAKTRVLIAMFNLLSAGTEV